MTTKQQAWDVATTNKYGITVVAAHLPSKEAAWDYAFNEAPHKGGICNPHPCLGGDECREVYMAKLAVEEAIGMSEGHS